ncbi:MAG: M23 family metallopeptidase [Patescibacteria group bacterium]|nr:M23 family metallopeptidase [Patescibacteria group bacterium]
MIVPFQVQAGFLSFVSGFFGNTKVEADTTNEPNSQNMALLHAAINTDPNLSKGTSEIVIVGGSALLSENGPLGTTADIQEEHINTQISVYVVREGDSLSRIAQLFNVSVNTILWANDLPTGSNIQPGQTLVILPVSGIKYAVKKGDTIESIAKKYKADVDDVLSYNGFAKNTQLEIGNELIIPDGEIASVTKNVVSKKSKSSLPGYSGYYMRPITGGYRTQGIHGYNGVDLADSIGTPVFAAADGIVIISKSGGWNGSYGSYIVISHPNVTQTLYAHLSGNIVSVGDSVKKGQLIGLVGSTGRSTGPHVHFEIRGAVNPF